MGEEAPHPAAAPHLRISAVANPRPLAFPPWASRGGRMDGGAGAAGHGGPGRRTISSAAASRRRLPPAENGHGRDGGASMRSSASISRANSPYVLIDGLDFPFGAAPGQNKPRIVGSCPACSA